MVQNTKALSYHLPLHFPISFTLHNIPIGYRIFSITELHLYSIANYKLKILKLYSNVL